DRSGGVRAGHVPQPVRRDRGDPLGLAALRRLPRMLEPLMHVVRLALAGRVLARHGVVVAGNGIALPTLARLALRLARLRLPFARNDAARAGDHRARLSAALVSLGPSYVKLGQFLATRPDVVGAQTAADLSELQDRLPPFSRELALEEVRRGLGAEPDELFEEIGPPVAAASIAQVHRGRTREPG